MVKREQPDNALRGPLEQLLDIVLDAYPKLVKDPQKKIL